MEQSLAVSRGRLAVAGRLALLLSILVLFIASTAQVSGESAAQFPTWQEPRLVKNLNSQTADSAIGDTVEMDGMLYFLAFQQGLSGDWYELWRTDGSPDGTLRLEAYQNWYPSPFHVLNDSIIFTAEDPTDGTGLWITNGSPGDAHLLVDIYLGINYPYENLTVAGNYLYFTAYDEVHHTEIWRTDGTAAGTIRLTGDDLNFDASLAANLANLNGTLYFLLSDFDGNVTLMKSNGSAAGTVPVTQIGQDPIYISISQFHNVGNLLYFTVGLELWRTDGTAAGTYKLPSIPEIVEIPVMIGGDSIFYVIAQKGKTFKQELWKSAGTAGTTVKVADIPYYYNAATTAGNRLFMICTDSEHGGELWTSDGTAAGTKIVKDIYEGDSSSNIHNVVPIGNLVYFGASESAAYSMRRLWRSDGTTSGTVPVPLGLPSDYNPDAEALAGFNGQLMAQISDSNHGREPWAVAAGGTSATFLADLNQVDTLSSNPGYFIMANDLLFLWTTAGLWKTDGSAASTALVVQNILNVREIRQDPWTFAVVGKWLYFAINDKHNNDIELWRTDGTPVGTTLVKDAIASMYNMDPVRSMADVNGLLYFTLFGQDRPRTELWRSDGTPGGTVYITTPFPAPFQQSSEIDEITGVGNMAYFVATNGINGVELWRSDATAAGTSMVKDIKLGAGGSTPSKLTAIGSRLLFVADDGIHGRELWRSDGTAGGTVLVKDILPGGSTSDPSELIIFNGLAYFTADNGTHGRELWRSDGTAAGTTMVKDILPAGSSNPRQLTTGDDWLYFFAGDGAGLNPYKSDGTGAGTSRIAVIQYNDFELPESLTAVGNMIFFTVGSTPYQDTLYQSDGTAAGTIAQDEAYPDFQAYDIKHLTAGPGRLYFSANHLMYGNEPFVKDLSLAVNSPSTLYLPEGSSYSYFRLSLKSKPATPMTVHFAADDPTVEIVPSMVTITPQNWNVPASIGVRAADDGQPGVREATITQTFESADSSIDGVVIKLPLRIGWKFGFVPVVVR